MSLPPLDNLVRIRQLKAEPGTQTEIEGLAEYEGHLEVDQALVEALIRVAQEVASRVAGFGVMRGQ